MKQIKLTQEQFKQAVEVGESGGSYSAAVIQFLPDANDSVISAEVSRVQLEIVTRHAAEMKRILAKFVC